MSTRLSTPVESRPAEGHADDTAHPACSTFRTALPDADLWITRGARTSSILTPRVAHGGATRPTPREPPRETHLPAKRPPPQAQARLPRAHVDARRADDPEAPPRQGAQAALRLSARPVVERRYRLSRSRDFDAVYRQGRSVSTRYLTLHWFPREDDPAGEPRLGLAVPKAVGNAVVRNRLKRQLRETWRELAETGAAAAATTCSSPAPASPSRPTPAATTGSSSRSARCSARRQREVPRRRASSTRGGTRFGLLTPAGTCKYHPSCSQYAIDAFRGHGLLKGGAFAGWRLLRCNPWSHGGVDYAEDARFWRRKDGAAGMSHASRRSSPSATRCSRSRTSSSTSSSGCTRPAGFTWALVDRRAHGDRADPARPDHRAPDPLDADTCRRTRRR